MSRRVEAAIRLGGAGGAVRTLGDEVAKGGERLCRLAAPFLEGAACGGRRACSAFGLACEERPSEAGERAGEDSGVAPEPGGRGAGLWAPPPVPGRLRAAGLGSAALRSGAWLAGFRGASARGRGRALEAGRGSPTSAPPPRGRGEMAGRGAPGVGKESRGKAEGKGSSTLTGWSPPQAQEPHPLRAHTSPRLHTQGTRSGSFWGFSSAPRLLRWRPECLLPQRA